jgi:hypothetical protein
MKISEKKSIELAKKKKKKKKEKDVYQLEKKV